MFAKQHEMLGSSIKQLYRVLTLVLVLVLLLSTNFLPTAARVPTTEALKEAALRDQVTYEELITEGITINTPVDNRYFLPIGDSTPALHRLQGRLTVPRMEMQKNTVSYPTYGYFPGFSVDFFTYDDYLVPATRTLIVNPGNWSLLLSPGKIWSEPGDHGMSRASFPFTLGSPHDKQATGGEAHNGVATFLFDEAGISAFRFQITQETAADKDIFDMWGQIPMEYQPGDIPNQDGLVTQFREELARQMPIHPWTELNTRYDPQILASFTEGLPPDQISAAGLVIDGVIYLQPSQTRYGEYPYPRYMHHAAMSISKTIGAGIAMLWLAQKYGDEVFDLKIEDYLEVTARHDGWAGVTFEDTLNMATGVGDNAPARRPFKVYANEQGSNYMDFYRAGTTTNKLFYSFGMLNYPWGPGEIFRYTSAQTFVLSAAMDAFLKSREGPEAHLWERLSDEVFRPIGIYHMTMMHVPNGEGNPGIPLMASGLRLTVDDIGKIATLLQNNGLQEGQQLLSPTKLAEALHRTGEVIGLPSGETFAYGDPGYHMSFWSMPHQTKTGHYYQVPFMSGAGGNTIYLAPNGVSTFVFTDNGFGSYSQNSAAVAEEIRPYPGAGLQASLFQMYKGIWLIPEHQQKAQTISTIILIWSGLVLLSLVWMAVRLIKARELTRWGKSIWLVAALFLGPVAILLQSRLRQQSASHSGIGTGVVLGASGLVMAGYALSWAIALTILMSMGNNPPPLAILGVSYLTPLLIGLLLVRTPLLRNQVRSGTRHLLTRGLLTEIITVNLGFAVFFPLTMLVSYKLLPAIPQPTSPAFWVMISLIAVSGVLVELPLHAWMRSRGYSLPTGTIVDMPGAGELPGFRSVWWVFLISLAILIGALGFTISQLG